MNEFLSTMPFLYKKQISKNMKAQDTLYIKNNLQNIKPLCTSHQDLFYGALQGSSQNPAFTQIFFFMNHVQKLHEIHAYA